MNRQKRRFCRGNTGKYEGNSKNLWYGNSYTLPSCFQFCLSPECRLKSLVNPSFVSFCPICLNNPPSKTCLSSRDSLYRYHQSRFETPTGTFSDVWASCWSRVPEASFPVLRYKSPSVSSSIDQWEKSINFKMSSKDYQRVCPSFPGLGRFLLVVLLMATLPLTSAMSPPPNYSQSNMPTTNFICADKATGGYYADPEAACQMFHVCVRISDDEMKDFRFLCPKDTVFDQQNFICTNWWEINCEKSTRYYNKNDLFREEEQTPEYEYENPKSPVYYEYIYEYVDEGTTTGQVEGEPIDEGHRLGSLKTQNDTPNVRVIEATHHSTTNNTRETETTTTKHIRRTTTTTTTTTTSTTTTTTPFSTTKRTPPVTATRRTTIHAPVLTPRIATPRSFHRLSFNSGSAVGRSSTRPPPSVVPRHRLTSRGGSTYLERLKEKESKKDQKNETLTLDLNSNDPYANYDWKKDPTGVTASARTRYETRFGATSSRGRDPSPKRRKETGRSNRRRPVQPVVTTTKPPSSSIEPVSSRGRSSGRKLPESQIQRERQPQSSSEAKHREFSNFRFYKTAFGRSYSSDDYLGTTGTTARPIRVSDPVRLERTASRNTRYSIYGP